VIERRIIRSASAVAAAFLIFGCGARTEYSMEAVDLERPTWDSLVVSVQFEQRTSVGRLRVLPPDSLLVVAYGTDGDTLFSGPGPGYVFPDNRLGSRERVLLDVCGALRGRWVCEQAGVRASPKRIHASADIDYPTDSDFRQGRFAIAAGVERDVLDGEGEERIQFDGSTSMRVEAYVDGADSALVRFPARSSSGSFDLSRHAGYSDFRFYLDSQLMDRGEATVHFVVYAGIEAADEPVAHIVRTVSPVRKADREANIDGFARQAGRMLADDLATFLGSRQLAAYVHAWNLNETNRRYDIDVEVRWRGSFFDQREYVLIGVLDVGENGDAAVFRLREGNRNALDRWDRRMRSSERRFGNLQVLRPTERYRPGGRRQDPL
jgi:hypothetical protein